MTGPLPRHIETAVAMGFAVDEVIDWPSGYVAGEVEHHDQWTWSQPYLRYAELLATRSVLGSVVTAHVEHWLRALSLIDDHASALIISSGGSIEPVLVAVMPDSAHESWGDALRHLEGATLTHDGTAFVDIEFHRSQI
jgi:hypothetical protein